MGHEPHRQDTPERYEIRVNGRLAAHWSEALGGMRITVEPAGTTLIHGPIDQAALHGVLRQIPGPGPRPCLRLPWAPPAMN